jgi:sugar transferase (PEP-CTERM/EpsH1 system associated)
MRILFLAHRLPYPPDKGERIRAYHELKFLGKRHSIDLFTFADTVAEAENQQALQKLCRRIYVEARNPITVLTGAVRSLFRGEPLSCGCVFSHRFQREVHRALSAERYDVIFVNCSSMAQYIPRGLSVRLVADFVDIDSAKWSQYAKRSRAPIAWLYSREARSLAQYEVDWARTSASTIVATRHEAALLSAESALQVEVVRNGVEIPAVCADELPPEVKVLQPYALFLGTMDYRPNVDAVEHFANDIFPLVRRRHPELKFVIAGRNPSRLVRKLARRPGIVVTGPLPRVDIYVAGSTVVVAPFRIAQGIQNKILEGLAAGKPVVSTSGPARAIGARPGETLLVADSAKEFADAVVAVLENPELRRRFERGRDFVRQNFDWHTNLSHLEQLLERASGISTRGEPVEMNRA